MHFKKYFLKTKPLRVPLFSLLFFICFYRVSLFYGSFYLALFIGISSLPLFLVSSYRGVFVKAISPFSVLLFLLLFTFSFVVDLVTGNIVSNFSSSFAIRLLFMVFCSVLPAYYIVCKFLKGSSDSLILLFFTAFSLQTILFFVSYFYPGVKVFLYSLMGASNSVNLNDWNMGTRGFGLSNEINYSSPFLMVILTIYFFRSGFLKVLVFLTQVINSNNAVVAAVLGLAFSRYKTYIKVLLFLVGGGLVLTLGLNYFPRLEDEFSDGGARTISYLFQKHFYILNDNILEFLMGTGIYIYGGASKYLSDIGFVIIFNYGGFLYSLLFLMLLFLVIIRVGYSKAFILMWLLVGVVLNFKGLLLGANGYIFMTFLFVFNQSYSKGRVG
ncbi:hypothetical protein [Vibrio scophthalmi]|uniref:Polysaccharide polymerase n=1 Tax=Vibrio scophthalmi TaxID=45658 RepID=A0A1C7FDZ2_9VIBR|nr:hypothetical protein [Vibrio scophthalmi]ANU37673.1 hypothetical protein VSVS05_02595 [Vibrio scophthalmi]